MTRLRCAILDDYYNLALTIADWSKITDRVDITVFNQPFASQEAAATALKDFEIICAMRERTAFPRSLFAALPKLKLLITSGMRNLAIDMEAAKDHKVVLCGTQWARDPTAPLTMGLILELTRKIGRENSRMHGGESWQKFVGIEIEGRTLGVVGLGKLGGKVSKLAQAFGMNVIAWSPNLTADRCKEVGVTYATKEELFSTRRYRHRPCGAEPTLAGAGRARRPRAHEADSLSGQHRARADRRRAGAARDLAAEEDRRCRHRRVLGRAAAA